MSFEGEWERCSPWLEAALKRSDEGRTLEEAKTQVTADTAQFWPFVDCAFVTEVLETPEGRCLHIWLGGGSIRGMLRRQETLAAWGRAAGCNHATINGRKGWARVLDGFEWRGGELRRELWGSEMLATTAR